MEISYIGPANRTIDWSSKTRFYPNKISGINLDNLEKIIHPKDISKFLNSKGDVTITLKTPKGELTIKDKFKIKNNKQKGTLKDITEETNKIKILETKYKEIKHQYLSNNYSEITRIINELEPIIKKLLENPKYKKYAHEINNTNTVIINSTNILSKNYNKWIKNIDESIKRSIYLIQEMKKGEKIIIKKHNLSEIIYDLNFSKIDIIKKIPLITNVYCDKFKIESVFLNLLKNSYEAKCKKATITMTQENNYANIKYTDDGDGFKEYTKIIDNLKTNNSYTTKNNGNGIGLQYCKKVIEEIHHGEFNIIKKLKGAQFNIKIPYQQ